MSQRITSILAFLSRQGRAVLKRLLHGPLNILRNRGHASISASRHAAYLSLYSSIVAVVLPDAIIRARGVNRSGDHASRAHDGQEEIERMQPRPRRPIRREIMPPLSGRNLTLRCSR